MNDIITQPGLNKQALSSHFTTCEIVLKLSMPQFLNLEKGNTVAVSQGRGGLRGLCKDGLGECLMLITLLYQ